MNPQPTIFISSIISEFYDLRGSLRYFLNRNGFRVLMSEENDFGADCNMDSLDNCKEQISKADYYLILIGNNPGTPLNIEGNNTTVTFEEYKHFKTLIKSGKKIQFLAFVRKQTWEYYTDLENTKIHNLQRNLIFDLLNDTILSDDKIGRWRYTFDKFIDIINVLETNGNGLFIDITRKNHIYRSYIRREVCDILKAYLEKNSDGNITSITQSIDLPDNIGLNLINKARVPSEIAMRLIGFAIVVGRTELLLRKIDRVFNYIAQGEFSIFDPETESYDLPDYIKLTIQALEILERIIENNDLRGLKKNNIENLIMSGLEYSIIQGLYSNLKIVISKLVSVVLFLNNNSNDLVKQLDEFYSYGKISGYGMKDDDVLIFAKSYSEMSI